MADDLRRMRTRRRDRRDLAGLAPNKIARQIARRIDRVVFFERRKERAPRGKARLRSWKRVHVPFSVVLLVTCSSAITPSVSVRGRVLRKHDHVSKRHGPDHSR